MRASSTPLHHDEEYRNVDLFVAYFVAVFRFRFSTVLVQHFLRKGGLENHEQWKITLLNVYAVIRFKGTGNNGWESLQKDSRLQVVNSLLPEGLSLLLPLEGLSTLASKPTGELELRKGTFSDKLVIIFAPGPLWSPLFTRRGGSPWRSLTCRRCRKSLWFVICHWDSLVRLDLQLVPSLGSTGDMLHRWGLACYQCRRNAWCHTFSG